MTEVFSFAVAIRYNRSFFSLLQYLFSFGTEYVAPIGDFFALRNGNVNLIPSFFAIVNGLSHLELKHYLLVGEVVSDQTKDDFSGF